MADVPLEFCPKCEKQLIYLKVKRKGEKAEIESICLDGHKTTFTTPIERQPIWIQMMGKRIFSCAKCGNRVIPDRNTLKREKYKEKVKVICKSGCNDKYEREIAKGLAEAIRRQVMQARRRGVKPFAKPGAKPIRPIGRGFPRAKPRVMVKFEIPEECPKCNAPLKKEEVEKLRNREVIECKYCGNAIRAKVKED